MSEREKRFGLSGRPEDSLSLALDAAELNLLPQDLEALRARERFGKPGARKGEVVENRVERILALMVEGGELSSFIRTEEEEDLKGIDFLAIKGRRKIPIQVKSSIREAEKFQRRMRRRQENGERVKEIWVVVAGREMSNLDIRRQVGDIVNRRKGKRP